MANGAPQMTEEDLMAMLASMGGAEGLPEEGGSMIPELLGAGAVGAYGLGDPYRRQLLGQLIMGPPGEGVDTTTRGRVAKGIGAGLKTRFTKPPLAGVPLIARKQKIGAGRKQTIKTIGKGTPSGKALAGVAKKGAPWAKLLGKAGGLGTPLGWLFAAMLAYDLGKGAYGMGVAKPRREEAALSQTLNNVFGGESPGESMIEQEALSDQLAGLARGSAMNPPALSTETEDILGAHDLSGLFQRAQKAPRPSYEQALALLGGL